MNGPASGTVVMEKRYCSAVEHEAGDRLAGTATSSQGSHTSISVWYYRQQLMPLTIKTICQARLSRLLTEFLVTGRSLNYLWWLCLSEDIPRFDLLHTNSRPLDPQYSCSSGVVEARDCEEAGLTIMVLVPYRPIRRQPMSD